MSEQAAQRLRTDPALAPYIDEFGVLELEPVEDTFRRLVVSVLRQQVSIASATAIQERLFDAVEISPPAILAADEETLQAVGLSEAKTEYVTQIARAYQDHGYDRAYFAEMDDEAVIEELTEIRGIGPWTAKMFLLFALARPDVFPVEDLGIRKGMEIVCDRDLTRGEMRERASEWAPYRSYASLYLWRAYEG